LGRERETVSGINKPVDYRKRVFNHSVEMQHEEKTGRGRKKKGREKRITKRWVLPVASVSTRSLETTGPGDPALEVADLIRTLYGPGLLQKGVWVRQYNNRSERI